MGKAGQSAQGEAGHCDVNPGFGGFTQCFVVLAQPPLQVQPAEGALHDPPPGQGPERYAAVLGAAPTPGSSRPPSWPTLPICRRRPHQPRSAVVEGTAPAVGPAPTGRRPGPECRPDALPPPAAAPGYPPRCGACGPSPSCRRRSLWAPFFRGLHRLAVDDGRAGTGLATLSLAQLGVQDAMYPLPGAITTPGAKVMEHDAPRWQVVGQHPPGATSAQHVADGVDDLPPGVGDGSAARFGRWQQGLEQLPFSVAEVAGIRWSFHTPKLRPTPLSCLCISTPISTFLDALLETISKQ